MSKKIRIEIKDIEKLEFRIKEEASEGDYFVLSELEEISFDYIKKNLTEKRDVIISEIWERNKDRLIFESKDFKELNQEKDELQKSLEVLRETASSKISEEVTKAVSSKEKEIIELNSEIQKIKTESFNIKTATQKELMEEYNSKINNLEQQKIQLENKIINAEAIHTEKINSIKNKTEKELMEEYNSKINNLEKINFQLAGQIDNLKNNASIKLESEILKKEKEIESKYNIELKEKDEQIKSLEQRRNLLNIKEIGEELEIWMSSEASNNLSYPNTIFKKANDVIDGTKPDFIFEILTKENAILSSVTIEAKSETLNARTKTKNREHIEKLDSDRKKQGSEYAILVTELEKDDSFIFKKVGEYENMYMVRPKYFIPLLQMIYNLTMKRDDINNLEINFKEKQEILNEFEDFKNEILETTMNKIEKNIEDINSEADKAIKAAEKIKDKARTAEKHLSTLDNKFNKFKIDKLVEKI